MRHQLSAAFCSMSVGNRLTIAGRHRYSYSTIPIGPSHACAMNLQDFCRRHLACSKDLCASTARQNTTGTKGSLTVKRSLFAQMIIEAVMTVEILREHAHTFIDGR